MWRGPWSRVVISMLMRSNRLPAIICSKSVLNRLIFDFFNPKSSRPFECGHRFRFWILFPSIYIKNLLISSFYCHFRYNSTFIQLFWSFNWLFGSIWSLDRSFNQNGPILNRNRDRLLDFVVGFRIGPQSTIEFRHRFWFDDDDSIRYP